MYAKKHLNLVNAIRFKTCNIRIFCVKKDFKCDVCRKTFESSETHKGHIEGARKNAIRFKTCHMTSNVMYAEKHLNLVKLSKYTLIALLAVILKVTLEYFV